MRQVRPKGCLTYILAWIVLLGAIIGWGEFLFKPVYQRPAHLSEGFYPLLSDLLSLVPDTYDWPLAGYLFLISSALLAFAGLVFVLRPVRAALNYLDTSEAPVSVLEARIEIEMLDPDFSRCQIRRTQKLHANRPDVDAYHYLHVADKGQVERGTHTLNSRLNGELITRDDSIERFSDTTLEIIERFERPLPTSMLVTYLPNRLVLFLNEHFGWFSKVIVTRTFEAVDVNEYDGEEPIFQLKSIRYPVTNIRITLIFPDITAPDENHVNCFLITSNAVKTIPVVPGDRSNGRRRYVACLGSLKQAQILRIRWQNTRLLDRLARHPV